MADRLHRKQIRLAAGAILHRRILCDRGPAAFDFRRARYQRAPPSRSRASEKTSHLPRNHLAPFSRERLGKPNTVRACQAGLVNNLNDGMSWGILPLFFAARHLPIEAIGTLKFAYPAVWAVGQLITGPLSDKLGRKPLIVWGMALQAGGIWLTVATNSFMWWMGGAALLGVGTAMVYPALIAVVGDVAAPEWRARSLSVYRFWRDLGYAIGALLAGVIADIFGLEWAIGVVGGLTLISGIIAAIAMRETVHPIARPLPGMHDSDLLAPPQLVLLI